MFTLVLLSFFVQVAMFSEYNQTGQSYLDKTFFVTCCPVINSYYSDNKITKKTYFKTL